MCNPNPSSDPLSEPANTSKREQPDFRRLGLFQQHERLEREDQLHLQRRRPQRLCVQLLAKLLFTHLPRWQHLLHSNLANMCIKYDWFLRRRCNDCLLFSKILSKSIWSWNGGDQMYNGNTFDMEDKTLKKAFIYWVLLSRIFSGSYQDRVFGCNKVGAND